jgi:hypothetical protein
MARFEDLVAEGAAVPVEGWDRYLSALVSQIPKRNGWTIAQHAGDRTPDRTQRLLNRAAWDAAAAMSQVRRFVSAGLRSHPLVTEQRLHLEAR